MRNIILILLGSLGLSGCWWLEFGMGGGYYYQDDWARGSHVSKAKADAAWKECSDKYIRTNSALVEQCMHDKGFIRLSEIKYRQENGGKLPNNRTSP